MKKAAVCCPLHKKLQLRQRPAVEGAAAFEGVCGNRVAQEVFRGQVIRLFAENGVGKVAHNATEDNVVCM